MPQKPTAPPSASQVWLNRQGFSSQRRTPRRKTAAPQAPHVHQPIQQLRMIATQPRPHIQMKKASLVYFHQNSFLAGSTLARSQRTVCPLRSIDRKSQAPSICMNSARTGKTAAIVNILCKVIADQKTAPSFQIPTYEPLTKKGGIGVEFSSVQEMMTVIQQNLRST